MLSRILLSASAAIMLFLGGVHLVYTALTHKLKADRAAGGNSHEAPPYRYLRPNPEWDAWIGFNFSHSLGLILFGPCAQVPRHMPMRSAAQVVFSVSSRIAGAAGLCRLGPVLGCRPLVDIIRTVGKDPGV
jgi:hypothetical protein